MRREEAIIILIIITFKLHYIEVGSQPRESVFDVPGKDPLLL